MSLLAYVRQLASVRILVLRQQRCEVPEGSYISSVRILVLRHGTAVHPASAYYYICVLILLYMCPHTTACVSSGMGEGRKAMSHQRYLYIYTYAPTQI
jgi:hypothetical protein